MHQAVATGCFPGAVLLVAKEKKIVHFEAYGRANLFNRTPMTRDTVFDLASLTKPLATTLALMELVRSGLIDLEQPLAAIISRFKKTEKAPIRIRDLLGHTAGLPAWRPYFRLLAKHDFSSRTGILKNLLIREPLTHSPGEKIVYSDLGFMILAWVVETIMGLPMGRYISQKIYRPMGLENLFFFPSLAHIPEDIPCAATELCPWRGILINGIVHDDNAYTTVGLQGQAGLFGPVIAVFRLLSGLLHAYYREAGSRFNHQLVRLFLTPQGRAGRALGFDVPSGINPACGNYFSAQTIGHLGFTGTSFWMDLDRSIIIILCTNRIHPSRHNNRIRMFRPQLHDAVMGHWVDCVG
ncbi:MAG: serine hydrolase [Thermodesulfobacteriota bacterium]|nr:serine hydrolase [Thermodesulfobacteriota bacterium]